MGLKTISAFTYGHTISEDNQFIDFSENLVQELGAQIDIGGYTLGDFINQIASAMNEIGSQEYSVTVDRTTRKITISSVADFDLYVTVGSRSSISAYQLMGFTTDRTGSNTYEGDISSGSIYTPQFILQKFVDFPDSVKSAHSSVNESASGVIETVSYGQINKMKCEIVLATDISGQGAIIENLNGVADLRSLMNYLITKAPIEFIPDIEFPEVLEKCLLDSTKEDSKGTGFQLYEMYARKLFGYFESKELIFRRLT